MAKEDYKNFRNSELRLNSGWICDSDYGDNDVKVRDHFHISGKYRGSQSHRDFKVNLKLTYKIPIVFYNLKK